MTHPPASTIPERRWSRRRGIGLRLLGAQAIVLAAGTATTAIVAAIVGPPLFREHLHRAGVPMNSLEEFHAQEAYGYATVISIGGALAVSAVAALAVSFYLSRRLQRSITEVASAATDVAQGNYDIRVSPPRLGDDFDALATAFNQMASRFQTVDSTRQRLFGDLAHEIRTPVAVLEAYIEALEDGVRTLTPQTTAMLRDQTRRLVRFSDDVAALAKAEESSFSMSHAHVDVERLTRQCVAAVQERYDNKGVALHIRLQDRLPQLWADEQRLSQVLGNLLDNALRHTPSGGSVELSCVRDDHRVKIAVADTGDGIAAEHLGRVFERFYRSDVARDREHGGAGLGLAIAKALVEGHGGSITVASAGPNAGATFTVHLPITPPRNENLPASQQVSPAPSQTHR
ncbi:sensor histidine kinase [Mycolicibacterium goodii]|uniref:sensor histidine kinase n=1 Tax=Mycolicibacterium goodii TaxID=134601 RepID=UPI001BDD24A5|nr:ATP-binding protein [Mycolicibacterium goodii]MBU8811713.1 HAMP domain-containing protein [Mycolicibacterium goodii]MBU8828731.1 HAMP domain-containing protein [Mycolicibacterium goodii]ULN44872.1 ATP-binding protein [Mycolicibacterium goodii]